ncbi:MAG: type II toxin-antitoxin system RelB/DinJ family antitoxin [Clostridiales bacterium]|nr:type II toxin-antitoxin system RelB/DinJ family antitoxin [Clostridiales bacterium]MCD8214534.1 type II toxin-antitoxin system RelB/DinJ family antitoxin [Clostridiales bacterium]
MAMANINIFTDEAVKAKCERLYESLGLNISTAVNIFFRQSLLVNGLPFDVKADIPNETTLAAFREGDAILADRSVKGYTDINDLRTALEV